MCINCLQNERKKLGFNFRGCTNGQKKNFGKRLGFKSVEFWWKSSLNLHSKRKYKLDSFLTELMDQDSGSDGVLGRLDKKFLRRESEQHRFQDCQDLIAPKLVSFTGSFTVCNSNKDLKIFSVMHVGFLADCKNSRDPWNQRLPT